MTPLPDVHFGGVGDGVLNWRRAPDTGPDDDKDIETPEDVLDILGFDPETLDRQSVDQGDRPTTDCGPVCECNSCRAARDAPDADDTSEGAKRAWITRRGGAPVQRERHPRRPAAAEPEAHPRERAHEPEPPPRERAQHDPGEHLGALRALQTRAKNLLKHETDPGRKAELQRRIEHYEERIKKASGSSAKAEPIAAAGPSSKEIVAMSPVAFRKYANDRLKPHGIELVSDKGVSDDPEVHPAFREALVNNLAALAEKYPHGTKIQVVPMDKSNTSGNADQWWASAADEGKDEAYLFLNDKFWGSKAGGPKELEKDLIEGNTKNYTDRYLDKNGFLYTRSGPQKFHDGMNDVMSIITHEYGHLMDFALAKTDRKSAVAKIKEDAFEETRRGERFVSRYGMTNQDEWWAEAFAVLHHGDDEAKQAPGVQEVANLLGEHFGRR